MAPFRRPGLEDDDDESRHNTLHPRPAPSFRGPPVFTSPNEHIPPLSFAGDGDSVSGLSAMSDLESLYLESSSENRPKNARDQYLLAQRLPRQAANASSSARGRRSANNLLNGFLDENDDEEDNWEDTVYAVTLQHSRQPQMAPKQQQAIDPAEQERLDLNRAIAESRLQYEKEQMLLAQIIEDDEDSSQKGKKSKKFSYKQSKQKDKKSDKGKVPTNRPPISLKKQYVSNMKSGMWSALTGKKTQSTRP